MLHALAAITALALTGPQPGTPAPDFRLTTVDGRSVTLASLRGKTVVINDWATWCPPCRQETADLIAVAKRARAGDVVFLGVDSTEAAPLVRAFVASKGVPYAQAVDADRSFAKQYDVTAYPSTFVIDPAGVLRARYVGSVSANVLASFIEDARAGRNGVLASEAQKHVDAILEPSGFAFTGDVDAVRATVRRALAAIDKAENVDGDTDYLRTQGEENVLRDAAVAALAPLATTDTDRALVARLRGDAATSREDWDAAERDYRDGLAVAPNDTELVGGLADVLRRRGDYAAAAEAYTQLVALDPSVDNLVELGNVQSAAHRFADARVSFARAIGTARARVQQKPGNAASLRKLAWAYLYEGRMFAKAGERTRARAAFAQTAANAARLPRTNAGYAMYLEEAQEATVALDAARGDGKTSLSLARWTGPDMPGAIASTLKYRLVVAGKPGANVALFADGLPKRWIASFCSDRVCAPFRTTVSLPAAGVKVIEFQVVPQGAPGSAKHVRIEGGGAAASLPA
ncbi:MAG: redoxin family protein [Candidatus Eremiobacteraeota bacterium]|nr:redoxin family protein [Candidatus Eremiobacteraeota bacterium]